MIFLFIGDQRQFGVGYIDEIWSVTDEVSGTSYRTDQLGLSTGTYLMVTHWDENIGFGLIISGCSDYDSLRLLSLITPTAFRTGY